MQTEKRKHPHLSDRPLYAYLNGNFICIVFVLINVVFNNIQTSFKRKPSMNYTDNAHEKDLQNGLQGTLVLYN